MTLIESLIAIFLLSLFVAGSVQVLNSVRRSADLSRMHFQALNMAKDRVERIRTFSFSQLGLAAESGVRLNQYGRIDAEGMFRRSTTVETQTNGLKKIVVRVEILNPRSRKFDMEQSMSTLMADYEVMP